MTEKASMLKNLWKWLNEPSPPSEPTMRETLALELEHSTIIVNGRTLNDAERDEIIAALREENNSGPSIGMVMSIGSGTISPGVKF